MAAHLSSSGFFLSEPRDEIQEALGDAKRIDLDDGTNADKQHNDVREVI